MELASKKDIFKCFIILHDELKKRNDPKKVKLMEYKIINKKQVVQKLNKLFKEDNKEEKIIDILNQFIWTLGFNDIHMILNRLMVKDKVNPDEEMIRMERGGYKKRKDLTEEERKQLEQTEKEKETSNR